MQANNLKLKISRKRRKFVGRGGKKGTYSGKGNKGQKARTGAHVNPLFEGGRSTLIDHMKKKRGFKAINKKAFPVNISRLEKKFKEGEIISRESLMKAGIIDKIEAKGKVKILGGEKLTKKLTIAKDVLISASSKEMVEKAGGKVESKDSK